MTENVENNVEDPWFCWTDFNRNDVSLRWIMGAYSSPNSDFKTAGELCVHLENKTNIRWTEWKTN